MGTIVGLISLEIHDFHFNGISCLFICDQFRGDGSTPFGLKFGRVPNACMGRVACGSIIIISKPIAQILRNRKKIFIQLVI